MLNRVNVKSRVTGGFWQIDPLESFRQVNGELEATDVIFKQQTKHRLEPHSCRMQIWRTHLGQESDELRRSSDVDEWRDAAQPWAMLTELLMFKQRRSDVYI